MSLTFKPINKDHLRIMAPSALAKVNSTDYSMQGEGEVKNVSDGRIFGTLEEHKVNNEKNQLVFEDEFTRVGYLEFPEGIKIINPFLAGGDYAAWRRLTKLSTAEIVDIVSYNKVFDKEEGQLIDVHSSRYSEVIYKKDRFVIGPDYLCHILDSINYKDMIIEYLKQNYLNKLNKKCKSLNLEDYVRTAEQIDISNVMRNIDDFTSFKTPLEYYNSGIKCDVGCIYLEGKYFLDLTSCKDELWSEEYQTASFAYIEMQKMSFNWQFEMMSESPDQFDELQLLTMAADSQKSNGESCKFIKDQILSYIFLMPYGYRPKNDFGESELTKAYAYCVKHAYDITTMQARPSTTLPVVMNEFNKFRKDIENIFLGDDDYKKWNPKYKSIIDDMKGKEGFIRSRLEGQREDFSGRTVITLDPTLDITEIGVPITILEKIAEPLIIKAFKHDAQTNKNYNSYPNMTSFRNQTTSTKFGISYRDYVFKYFKENTVYGVIGRQPTLYYLGIQSFKIKPVDSDSILLSPLIVMPFNADFDGDQMHISLPQTQKGIEDVANKMLFKNNIWYPKNGALTVVARHEIQYGIWQCVTSEINENSKDCGCSDRQQVFEKLCRGEIDINDKFQDTTAGKAAFLYTIFGVNLSNKEVEDKLKANIKNLIKVDKDKPELKKLNAGGLSDAIYNLKKTTDDFLAVINKLVKLGFGVSKFYPPAITVVTDDTLTKNVRDEINKFNNEMAKLKHYVDIGLELESNYNLRFTDKYNELSSSLKKYLMSELDDENGYKKMVISGSKGDDNNILQIFGLKGRVQKNDTEAFSTTIDGSYAGQLTGLEHFVTAYGSRKGIADKVLSTAKPGYMSRKLEHAGAPLKITYYDCSENGVAIQDVPCLKISAQDVIPFIELQYISRSGMVPSKSNSSEEAKRLFYSTSEFKEQLEKAEELLAKVLVGRFCVRYDESNPANNNTTAFMANKSMALEYIKDCWKDGRPENVVRLRSPITCKNPCCQICYGRDLTKGSRILKTEKKTLSNPNMAEFIKRTSDIAGNIDFDSAEKITSIKQNLDGFNYVYGKDYDESTNTYTEVTEFIPIPPSDKYVGFIAAQAIGEPGTQMTMKNFQKGGVVGDANITSSFDLIESSFDLKKWTTMKLQNNVVLYDPVSPVEGYVKTINIGGGISRVVITETDSELDVNPINKWDINVYSGTELKPYVRVGDSIMLEHGTVDVRSKIKYAGMESALIYQLLNFLSIFNDTDVNSIHFECILRNMLCYKLLKNYGRFKAGDIITFDKAEDVEKEFLVPVFIGVKYLPKYKSDFLQSLAMESMTTYVPSAILTSNEDDLSDPIMRTAFGLSL